MTKKINPARRLVAETEVRKALHEGIDVGCNWAVRLVLYLLMDKHEWTGEQARALNGELNRIAGQIAEQKMSWKFIDGVLEENGVEVRMR